MSWRAAPQGHQQMYPCLTSPIILVINSLPCLLQPVYLMCSLDKTPVVLMKTLLFYFELTNLTLGQEPQSTPPTYSHKGMCARSYLSVGILPGLPMWPLRACHVLPPRSISNNLPCFNLSGHLLSIKTHLGLPCST